MAKKTSIYHNPRCTKCRLTKALLDDNAVEYEVIEYLDTPPSEKELAVILKKLCRKPLEVIRTGEIPSEDLYYRLSGAGLVRREGQRINPVNLLYALYFKKVI